MEPRIQREDRGWGEYCLQETAWRTATLLLECFRYAGPTRTRPGVVPKDGSQMPFAGLRRRAIDFLD